MVGVTRAEVTPEHRAHHPRREVLSEDRDLVGEVGRSPVRDAVHGQNDVFARLCHERMLRSSVRGVTDLANLDATAQAELVRNGRGLAARIWSTRAIERIEKLNGELNAVIHPLYERARAAVNAGLPDGPFTGVPIAIKDLDGVLADAPYHGGNKLLKEIGYTPKVTSYLFAKLEARRVRDRRQDQHARVRSDDDDRVRGVRARAQPVGHRRAAPAVRAAGRRPRPRPGWCRSRTPATAADRSAYPRVIAACSD